MEKKSLLEQRYCDIELCRKLNDDGIEVSTNNYWIMSHDFKKIGEIEIGKSDHMRIDPSFKLVPIITHQMAVDYLYDKYRILVEINIDTVPCDQWGSDFKLNGYTFMLWSIAENDEITLLYEEYETYKDRYDAVDNAIIWYLNNAK